MSESGPLESGGPLNDLLRDLARLLSTQGPVNWEIASQMAQWTATEGETETNPDPLVRIRLEELLRVADLHVSEATGLPTATSGGVLTMRAVSRGEWARRTLDAWRPLLEGLAVALTPVPEAETGPEALEGGDPMSQMFANLPQVMMPLVLGMQAGMMVGHLATQAMGQYDPPVPRPASDELLLVPSTIDQFAADWSLAVDDVRLWICLHQVALHAVLGRPHVRARLDELLQAYVGGFDPRAAGIEEHLAGFDPTDMAALQEAFSNPEVLLGDMETPAQRQVMAPLQALLSAVSGYVDYIMDVVGRRLIGSYAPLTEALRRRRVAEGEAERYVGRLLGISLPQSAYERGNAFVRGVFERAGEAGLARLWHSAFELPTPAELEAPGLWLARIDLPEPGGKGPEAAGDPSGSSGSG
jgi:putative hydrolase